MIPEPAPRHPGPRGVAAPPHAARAFRRLQRQVDDAAWQVAPQELRPVDADVTTGKPCTAGSYADLYRFWTCRKGAGVYADVAAGCGTGSVVRVRLACPDFTLTGDEAVSPAGGEHVLHVSLALPDAWQPGEARYVTVQAYRSSGTDATTLQVLHGWQR